MSAAHTQADALIIAIEQASLQRAQRLGEEAALTQQVADLEALVRKLCDTLAEKYGAIDSLQQHEKTQRGIISDQRDTISRLRATIIDLRGDLEDARDKLDFLDPPAREAAVPERFTAGDAADAAQWGA